MRKKRVMLTVSCGTERQRRKRKKGREGGRERGCARSWFSRVRKASLVASSACSMRTTSHAGVQYSLPLGLRTLSRLNTDVES